MVEIKEKQGGKRLDTYHASRRFFLSYYASQKSEILTTLTGVLLSFDLRKSEVEEREKRARSGCHNCLFLMSLLLVSNDINHRAANLPRHQMLRLSRIDKEEMIDEVISHNK